MIIRGILDLTPEFFLRFIIIRVDARCIIGFSLNNGLSVHKCIYLRTKSHTTHMLNLCITGLSPLLRLCFILAPRGLLLNQRLTKARVYIILCLGFCSTIPCINILLSRFDIILNSDRVSGNDRYSQVII